jgi:hypothetical protein
VKKVVRNTDQVYLSNRFDGVFITHEDIARVLNVIQGRGI